MEKIFKHIGYHLDVYCIHTKKYLGSITLAEHYHENCEKRIKGYNGRIQQKLLARGRKGTKEVKFNGEYITELIPLCGRIVGDRFATLAESRMRQLAFMGRRNA